MIRRVVANNILLDQASALVAEGKEVEIPTKGASMLPFIVGGKDSVVLARARQIDVGDIVMAKIGDTNYVVHRIIRIEGSQITLMGDGNIRGCELCTHAQISAKIIAIRHKGKLTDCTTPSARRRAKLWRMLRPLRRYILGVWRRTPFWPMTPQG